MEQINKYRQYLKDLLGLALPLFIGSLGHTIIGACDVLVIAKYNVKSLAAVSIANSIFFIIMIAGIGVIAAVSIILPRYRGEKKNTKQYLFSTLVLSALLSALFAVISYCVTFIIPYINIEKELIPYIQEYIAVVSFSMFGIFIFEGIRQFLQSFEIVKMPNLLVLAAAVLNLIADIAFVFGWGFIPEMGSKGAAIATLLVRTLMSISLLIYVLKRINMKLNFDFSYIKTVIKTGVPIGIALVLEFTAFNIVTVLAGIEKSIFAAVHSILITISNAVFMVPFALSTALSVKVAYYCGADKPEDVKNYSFTAICFVLGFMAFVSLILSLFPEQIISIFTSDEAIMDIAVPLISILAAYQIFDGLQSVTGGILKGFKLTKTVSLTVLAGYWLIGAPIAFILVSKFGMQLKGYWIALAMSLFSMGLMQSVIAKNNFKRLFTKF